MKKLLIMLSALVLIGACEKKPDTYVFENPNYDDNNNPPDTTDNNPPDDTTQPADVYELKCSKADSNAIFVTGTVIDAEYSKSSNLMVLAVNQPNELLIVDVATGNVSAVGLNKAPTAVSISPGGQEAIVGHDGGASHVDMNQKSLLNYYTIPCNAFDIVAGGNNYAYAFPKLGQHTDIVCLNLNNGVITNSTGNSIYHRTRAKLQPGTNFIYGADNGVSPSDIEKYSISGGTAHYLYDSPFHGDYPIGGNLWFNESGTRVITKSRTILQVSQSQSVDMTYSGTLAGKGGSGFSDFLISADHSDKTDKLYTIFNNGEYSHSSDFAPDTVIRVYGGTYFGYEKSIPIPFVKENGECYKTEAYYGFFNSNGVQFYVVQEATSIENPNKSRWAISTIN